MYKRLLNYSMHALGRRALTEFEMRDKLKTKAKKLEAGKEDIPQVIQRLKDLSLIDDETYVRNFIKTKTALSPSGRFGVFQKLRRKGIAKDFFDEIWDEIEPDEDALLETATAGFIRKKGEIDSQKQKERLTRYLASRGFRPDCIYKKLQDFR